MQTVVRVVARPRPAATHPRVYTFLQFEFLLLNFWFQTRATTCSQPVAYGALVLNLHHGRYQRASPRLPLDLTGSAYAQQLVRPSSASLARLLTKRQDHYTRQTRGARRQDEFLCLPSLRRHPRRRFSGSPPSTRPACCRASRRHAPFRRVQDVVVTFAVLSPAGARANCVSGRRCPPMSACSTA